MQGRIAALAALAATLVVGAAATPAQAGKSCGEPGSSWDRATPAEAGMDAAKLQDAMDYGSENLSFAVRVYRHGCLVAEDRAAPTNRNTTYESYSMGKSVTALLFGRAMELGLISPDDPVGSLVPEADRAHGRITMRDLLTQTSGLEWNGFRDYNVFTQPDRIHDALTLGIAHPPGTYFEYAQSPVSLLAEAIARAYGHDTKVFADQELMGALGIPSDAWSWTRDSAGHVGGFWGVQMRPDDYGRLGELMRRGGVWRGRRLLSKRFMRDSIAPSPTNGCYGWLIWVNAAAPCIYARITERPVRDTRDFPEFPADMYEFAGLFGQRVTLFPSQGIVVVRTGQDRNLLFSTGGSWEHELYKRVLGAVTDQKIDPPGDPPKSVVDKSDSDSGFQDAFQHPDRYQQGVSQDPLPPAGQARARAAQLSLPRIRASKHGTLLFRLYCPPRWPSGGSKCKGLVKLEGAKKKARYSIAAGERGFPRLRLTTKQMRSLRRKRAVRLNVVAVNNDVTGGTPARDTVAVWRPQSKGDGR